MSGAAGLVVRRPGLVALAWLAVCAALLPQARQLQGRLEVGARVDGSESAEVEAALAERFESPFAQAALLVITGGPPAAGEDGIALLRELVETLRGAPGVARVYSYLDTRDPSLVGAGGSGTYVVLGLDPKARRLDESVPLVRARAAEIEARARTRFPNLTLRLTGTPALNYDLRRTSAAQVRAAERRALPLTLGLLLLAFGALVAAGLPLLVGALTIGLALGAAALLARVVPLNLSIVNTISMLGLGLSVDYALLTVARFREGLHAGLTPTQAAADARRHAGGTLALSGAAFGLGCLCLLAVPVAEMRSVAWGSLLVAALSVLLSTTLLPALLAWLGPRIDAGRIGTRRAGAASERWRRFGQWIAAHPRRVLVIAGLPLLALGSQAARLRTGLPNGDWLPPQMESARAMRDLRAMGHAGLIHEARIVLELPEGTSALSGEGWEATRRVALALRADPRVARVRWLGNVAGEGRDELALASLVPYAVKRVFVGGDGEAALLAAVPRGEIEPNDLIAWARELRRLDPGALTGLPGARLKVGGLPAVNADYADAVGGRLPRIVGLVVLGTLVALLIGFRAPLIAVKAVVLNLFAVAAAFGAVVLVFQDGLGVAWLGLAEPPGRVFSVLPGVVFCTVFGLSLDYEIFLVARLAEGHRAGLDDRAALAEALSRTGGVITSAAAIMVAVFAAFTLGDFLLVKMLGFALATAVLLDATVVRVALGPALVMLAGRWNWWPERPRA